AQLCGEVAASGWEPAGAPGRIAAAAADGRAPRRAGQSGEPIAISEITVVSIEMPPSRAPSTVGRELGRGRRVPAGTARRGEPFPPGRSVLREHDLPARRHAPHGRPTGPDPQPPGRVAPGDQVAAPAPPG